LQPHTNNRTLKNKYGCDRIIQFAPNFPIPCLDGSVFMSRDRLERFHGLS
jgi:hypothetical protein